MFLQHTLTRIQEFLQKELLLELHPGKVSIQKFRQGVDFLGYIILPRYIVMRTKTRKRMMRKLQSQRRALEQGLITRESFHQSLQSYLGMLQHCQGRAITRQLISLFEEI